MFQRVLEGIEDSLNVLATDSSDLNAYNRLLASGERLSALVIAHALSIRDMMPIQWAPKTSASTSTEKARPQG